MPRTRWVRVIYPCLAIGFTGTAEAASTSGEALPGTQAAHHAKSAVHKPRHVRRNGRETPSMDTSALSRPGLGTGAAPGVGSEPQSGGEGGWSVGPKVSATNGATAGAYSTRALYDQLNSRNSDQESGYRAGAELKFKF